MLASINPVIVSAIISLFTALLVLLLSKYFDRKKQRSDFAHAYQTAYFEKQIAAYQALWALYRPLSKNYDEQTIFNRSSTSGKVRVNDRVLNNFCSAITQFFFSSDGIFISRNTRKHLFSLRDQLETYANEEKDVEQLRKCIHTLSAELFQSTREDIGLVDLELQVDQMV